MQLSTGSLPVIYPVLCAGGGEIPLLPLLLRMESCATQEQMHGNVYATFSRGYERLNEYMDTESGEVSICGAGPSLRESYTELSGDVIACNSAIGFLLSKGIAPKYAMLWDASELIENFAVPHPEVTYLVASRCHPKVFERLEGCRVIVWHAGGDHDITNVLEGSGVMEPMVNGGSAAVTRGLYLTHVLGYRKFHLHGADSSYSGELTHVNGSLVPEKKIRVQVKGDVFYTTPEWAAQVEEFKHIYRDMTQKGSEIEVHGSGLLPTVWKLLQPLEGAI